MSIQAGEHIPEAILQYIDGGVQKVDTLALFEGRKLVLFAVPGAFTPTCSERHLPSFVEHYDEFQRRGIGVACMAVNDAFVMQAWGESQHVPQGLRVVKVSTLDEAYQALVAIGQGHTDGLAGCTAS